MPLFTWGDEFSVHVKVIDAQHRRLVEMLNALHDAMTLGKAKEVLANILRELLAYTDYHFRTEEELMRNNGYPAYAAHKAEHDALRTKAQTLDRDARTGRVTVAVELSELLRDWLAHHINGTDKALGTYLKAEGID